MCKSSSSSVPRNLRQDGGGGQSPLTPRRDGCNPCPLQKPQADPQPAGVLWAGCPDTSPLSHDAPSPPARFAAEQPSSAAGIFPHALPSGSLFLTNPGSGPFSARGLAACTPPRHAHIHTPTPPPANPPGVPRRPRWGRGRVMPSGELSPGPAVPASLPGCGRCLLRLCPAPGPPGCGAAMGHRRCRTARVRSRSEVPEPPRCRSRRSPPGTDPLRCRCRRSRSRRRRSPLLPALRRCLPHPPGRHRGARPGVGGAACSPPRCQRERDRDCGWGDP